MGKVYHQTLMLTSKVFGTLITLGLDPFSSARGGFREPPVARGVQSLWAQQRKERSVSAI